MWMGWPPWAPAGREGPAIVSGGSQRADLLEGASSRESSVRELSWLVDDVLLVDVAVDVWTGGLARQDAWHQEQSARRTLSVWRMT